jgi:hypothetical protein
VTTTEELVVPGAALMLPQGGFGVVASVSRERDLALILFQNGSMHFLTIKQTALAIIWLSTQDYKIHEVM